MRSSFALDGALPHYFLPLLAAMIALAGLKTPAQAQAPDRSVFLVDANDGYGVADCLTRGGACGQIVADAWCEAQGFRKAAAFGRADDVTATVDLAAISVKPPKDSVIIRCSK